MERNPFWILIVYVHACVSWTFLNEMHACWLSASLVFPSGSTSALPSTSNKIVKMVTLAVGLPLLHTRAQCGNRSMLMHTYGDQTTWTLGEFISRWNDIILFFFFIASGTRCVFLILIRYVQSHMSKIKDNRACSRWFIVKDNGRQ